MKLVLATNNVNKIREMKSILGNFFEEIVTLKEIGFNDDVEETGDTFFENALIKAKAISKFSNLPALADDSGLVVEALNGEPGVYSARYAGDHNDENNIKKLLDKLKNVNNRKAKFVTSIVLYYPNGEYIETTGEVYGNIIDEKRGSNGFGYDPVFFSTELNKTFAEASGEEKNSVSHRGRALKMLIQKLSDKK
ncbi:MAG: XTP/dITP diphosphatase [Clostridia bacterium]|nr:XTP/dITP diphosphatase [Clostridia bacterium]